MNIGRNEPCHCGSGKKYKKCCLARDEEAERAKTSSSPSVKPAPVFPPIASFDSRDESDEAWDERWKDFEEADYEKRIELFQQTLAERELMDREMAFEMLNELFTQTVKKGERDRFEKLLKDLREQLPEVYEEEAGYFLDWRIVNATFAGKMELAGRLMREYADLIPQYFDGWRLIEERMAYHGQLAAIVETMRAAWPEVDQMDDVAEWGIDEFRSRALNYEMLDYLETQSSPFATDPILVKRIQRYGDEFLPEITAMNLAALREAPRRPWKVEDFQLKTGLGAGRFSDDEVGEVADNYFTLSMQFVGYAHRVAGVSYSKAELARSVINGCILEPLQRELDDWEAGKRSKRGRGKVVEQPSSSNHPLCPSRADFDRCLLGLVDMMMIRFHAVAAAVELMPLWLQFLEARGLIDGRLRRETLGELRPLVRDIQQMLANHYVEPCLAEALRDWAAEDKGD